MNEIIVEAIKNKKLIKVTYNGAERMVEPHAYGLDKNGAYKLRAFQVGEVEHAGWRLFNETGMTDIATTETAFEPNPGYKQNDRAIEDMIVQL